MGWRCKYIGIASFYPGGGLLLPKSYVLWMFHAEPQKFDSFYTNFLPDYPLIFDRKGPNFVQIGCFFFQ